MTTYNKTNLKTFFQNGDVPTGQNYSDLIDSQINIVETGEQDMAGPLGATKLIAPRVSATNANFTNVVSAVTFNSNTGTFSGIVSANSLNVTTDVSASQGTVYASALRSPIGIIGGVTIVSAAGTARSTAAPMSISFMVRGQGVTDGSATGFQLPVPLAGYEQRFIYEGAVSANLWPVGSDYTINALASGAAFALTANTTYIVLHKTTSAYAVK